eukprot:6180783-Amphidinium_carterae.1
MRFLAIVRRYLKTWFFVDCVIVGLDWMTYGPALATGGSGALLQTRQLIQTPNEVGRGSNLVQIDLAKMCFILLWAVCQTPFQLSPLLNV